MKMFSLARFNNVGKEVEAQPQFRRIIIFRNPSE